MKVKEILSVIDQVTPFRLALDWDNVGLLIGDDEQNAKNVLMTIDITRDVLAEAKRLKSDCIISYHPVIWDGLKKITPNGETEVVYELIRSGIPVISVHTAVDITWGGVNDGLAEILGLEETQPIGDYVRDPGSNNYKLVVYVPIEAAEKVAQAMFRAGAGAIGNYSKCSFQSEGTGTFLPLEGAKPAIGKPGKCEQVSEIKIETIVPAKLLDTVVKSMIEAHPYETPAYDILKLLESPYKYGLGRMGKLAKPRKISELLQEIKKQTGAKSYGIIGPKERVVRTAAVCAGSCGKIISQVIAEGCDFYLTGELKHHQAMAAQEAGLSCICLSHSVSERFILKKLAKVLQNLLKDVKINISRKDCDPFTWKIL